jgi:hypothetical protein
MKRYKGKSACQILNAAKIETMCAGNTEIVYGDMIINALSDDNQIHLRNVGGLVASVDLTPRSKARFDQMIEVRDGE